MANVRKDRIQVEVEINGEKVGKTIADLQKQYRNANKELRNLTIGSEEFVAKQQEIAGIKKELDDQRKAVNEYAKALEDVQPRSIIALTRRVTDLKQELKTLDPATQEYVEKSKQLNQVEAELADITKEAENIQRELAGIEPDSLEALEQQAKTLRSELKKLSPASEEFRKKSGELKEVETQMEAIGDAAKNAGKVSILSAEGIKKAFKSLDVALKATIIGFLAGLATSLLSSAQAAIEATGAMQDLREELNRLTGEVGDELDTIAARTQATADTFQVELKDAIQATNAASKAFGQEYSETLTLIQQGLIVTGAKGEEFLEQVKEYSPLLRQAGLTAEQSFAVISDAINRGIFNDKAADAIKEFDLRIKDLSKGQREVLEQNLGRDFTTRIVEGIETGKVTSIEALGEIAGELGQLGADSAATQKVISNLFGGPGEDAGADFIISLQNVKGGFRELIDESNIYVQRQREQLALEEEASKALADLSFQLDGTGAFFKRAGTAIKTGFLQALVGTINFFQGLPTQIKIVGVKVLEGINVISQKGSELLNAFIEPIRKLAELTGLDIQLPEIKLPTFEIDTTPEQLQAELFNRLAQQKKEFAENQKQQALAEQNKQAAAERLNALRLQKQKDQQTSEEAKRLEEEFARQKTEASRKIQDLEAELIQDETQKKITQIQLATRREIDALQGTEEQITQQRKLLVEKRNREIDKIEQDSLIERIAKIQVSAQQEIAAIEATGQSAVEERRRIEQERDTQIEQVISETESRKITRIQEQADQEIAALKGTEEQITQERIRIIQERDAQIETVRKQLAQTSVATSTEAQTEVEQAEEAAYQKRLARLERFNQEKTLEITQQVIAESEAGTLREDLEEELQERLLDQYNLYLSDKLALEQEFGVDSLATYQDTENKKLEATKERIAKELEEEKKRADEEKGIREGLAGNIEGTLQNLQTVNSNILEQQVSTLEKRKQEELALAGDNAAKRQQIEEKYQEEQAKLEEQAAKRRRLIAIAQKVMAIRETAISTARSIMKVSEVIPFPASIPFQIALGALGATQIAAIATQKFEQGGELPVTRSGGGVTEGPRHRDKGIKLVDSKTGQIVGEVEGGEPILSRATYENNRELIDRLLYSSKNLGGARIYEQGGILSAPSTTPSRETVETAAQFSDANIVTGLREVRDAIRQVKLRIGEREAVSIGEMDRSYQGRVNGTGL